MYDEVIARFLQQGAHMLQSTASEQYAPVVHGRLRGDITVFPQTTPTEIRVGNTSLIDYAVFVYYGTGIYGPEKKKIVPKTKKALKTPYGPRKSIKGQKPNPYLELALEDLGRSGKLLKLLDGFGEEMSEEMFKNITKGLKNIKVK